MGGSKRKGCSKETRPPLGVTAFAVLVLADVFFEVAVAGVLGFPVDESDSSPDDEEDSSDDDGGGGTFLRFRVPFSGILT